MNIEQAPTGFPICGKIEDTKKVSLSIGLSQTRLGLLNLVSISSTYREQKVRDSSTKYPSAMDPSGRALFLTKDFK